MEQRTLVIREEQPGDRETIREVNRAAFGGEMEASLVDQLRADDDVIVSLVAVEDGLVAGHILFSRLQLQTAQGEYAAAALAPLAVRPSSQRRGIGSALVRDGLASCWRLGLSVVAVLGHPDYYSRFGFSSELGRTLAGPYSDAGAAWMALELRPGALAGGTALARFARAFDRLGY